jgi:putative membrane protein
VDGIHGLTALLAHGADGWGPGGWGWLWGLSWMAFWFGTIFMAMRFFRGRRREPTATERAKNILAERYARGEMTTDEYMERVAQLG